MKNSLITFIFVLGLSFISTATLSANETDSSFSVELGKDNNEGSERYFDLTLGLSNGMRLLASQGQSEINDVDGALQNDSWSIGMTSDPYADVGLAVYYSYWGDKSVMEINTLALDLIFNTENWGFIVSPQTRDIRLDGQNQRDTTFNSQGIGFSADYYGVKDFYFSAAYLVSTYPDNLSVLSNNSLLSNRVFSSTTLDRAFGLEDKRTTLGFGYSFYSAIAGFQRSTSEFAIDQSRSTIDTIYVSWNVDKQWRLKLSVASSSQDENIGSTTFTNMAVTYRW